MDIHSLIGFAGMAMILLAFILLQFHKVKDTTLSYDMLNLIGSAALCWYAFIGEAWPFFVLNAVWGIVSARDVFQYYFSPRTLLNDDLGVID